MGCRRNFLLILLGALSPWGLHDRSENRFSTDYSGSCDGS